MFITQKKKNSFTSCHSCKTSQLIRSFSGANGKDFSPVRGGEGGILIDSSGPSGEPGGGNISASGGAGYGAGGGGGGGVYLVGGSALIYPGGTGADGAVYLEMVDSGVCITYAIFLFLF